jgi:hypothetical protein
MMYDAVEYAYMVDGRMKRNIPVKTKDIYRYLGQKLDTYISLATYNEHELYTWINDNGSIAGNDLSVWFPYITYDLDKMDVEQVKAFLIHLEVNYEIEDYRIYYSGAKGFHIQIPSDYFGLKPAPDLNRIIKGIAFELAEDVLEFDPSIYDKQRIFRLPNTINSKSGLYKIPLSFNDLTSADDIIGMAKQVGKLHPRPDVTSKPHLTGIAERIQEELDKPVQVPVVTDTSSTITVPLGKKHCIYTLLNGVEQGSLGRDPSGMRIADYFKKEGLDSTIVHGILTQWNERNQPALSANDIQRIVKQTYSNSYDFGCNDAILKSVCNDNCFLYKNKQDGHVFKDVRQMEMDYKAMIQLRKEAKINTGIDEIDKATRGLAPQLVMTIVARSASFKSAILQNILMNYSYAKPALWFSQEMPSSLVYERLVQIEKGMTGEDVEHHYVSGDGVELDHEKYNNFYVDVASGLSVQDIEERIIQFKEQVNPELYLVGIDYLQIISGYGSLFERVEAASKELKEVAKRNNIAIVILSQSNRDHGGDGTKELGMDSGKGGGAIEEAADFLLTVWKGDNDVVYAKISKNRLGKSGQKFKIDIDPATLTINRYAQEVDDEDEELPW